MSQYAAIEAMKNGDDDIEYMRGQYDMRRRLIVDGLNNMGLKRFEPEGAFYVFPSVKSTGLTSMEFCERLIRSHRVAVVPGDAFLAPAARALCASPTATPPSTSIEARSHGSVPQGAVNGREKVWLSRCGGYAPEELLRQMEEAFLTALGVWEEIRPGMKVVLKPNLVMSSKPEAAIATHPALVAAVGKCVQKAGERR